MLIRRLSTSSLLAALLGLTLLLSACGGASVSSNSSKTITAGQVLQNSVTSMQKLKTVHMDFSVTENLQTQSQGTATPTSQSSTTPNNLALSMQGSGDEIFPDQTSSQMKLSVPGLGTDLQLNEIIKDGKVYIQNKQGQWYVLEQSSLTGTSSFLGAASSDQYSRLLTLAQKAQLTDHGDQSLHGQNLRHISVTFGKDALKDLLNSFEQLPSGLSQSDLQQIEQATTLRQAGLELWIDEQNFYVHELGLNLKMDLDLNKLVQATPTTSSSGLSGVFSIQTNATVDYSKFNQPVTINAPANATPTDNPLIIFQQ
ncbi:DUF6612 family protein [Thermogemmatispora tikiterensis]|uniref:LppX_LprAFG lipoprotein n=1 Tax=Thermogemmatispora tikiterensis TaxID=1825093 RepID=A0A328VNL2_9CHLR|nr:DUF6612 family protein [Thermogemmatispora tikiterensis]RAQ97263.1 hypothetical protein A4R35_17120 [Thermogemmatispora tikiterensis]